MASFRDILRLNARPQLALDFGADFVAVRHAPEGGEWTEIGAAPLDAPDFTDQLMALAEIARDATNGDMRAELWLPANQIVNLHLDESPRLDLLARRKAAPQLAGAVNVPAPQLRFDLSIAGSGGRRAACATEATTVDEACAYAAAWGFDPVIVTTRHAAAAFTRPPRFDGSASRRAAAPFAALAAAAVALVIGAGVFFGLEDGPHQPPAVNLETVATAPSPVRAPAPDQEATAIEARDSDIALAAPTQPDATLDVEQSEPEGDEEPLAFRVEAGTPPLSPPELEAPPSLRQSVREPSDLGGAATIVAPLAPEAVPAPAVTVDQTPVEPPPVADAATQDIAEAETEDASPPETPSDPVEAAEEAEEWVEAEGQAEAEAGADAPDSVIVPHADDPAATEPERDVEPAGDVLAEAGDDPAADADLVFGEADPGEVAILAPSEPIRRPDASPALPESDDFDEIDLGPGPGSVLKAPAPGHRPAALDMTPSDLAVLTSPDPKHRPASIKPRPKPIAPGTRTVRAPNRGKPSGPGLSRAATLEDVLPLDDVSLLGTFGQGKARRALLRMPSGEVVRVSRGDVVQGWVVGKIEALSMRITRGGEARTLPLAR